MKKISALLVVITSSLFFTGCPQESGSPTLSGRATTSGNSIQISGSNLDQVVSAEFVANLPDRSSGASPKSEVANQVGIPMRILNQSSESLELSPPEVIRVDTGKSHQLNLKDSSGTVYTSTLRFSVPPAQIDSVVPIESGGTSASNPTDAKKNLGIRQPKVNVLSGNYSLSASAQGEAVTVAYLGMDASANGSGVVQFQAQVSGDITQNGDIVCNLFNVTNNGPDQLLIAHRWVAFYETNKWSNTPSSSHIAKWDIPVSGPTSILYQIACRGLSVDYVNVTGKALYLPLD